MYMCSWYNVLASFHVVYLDGKIVQTERMQREGRKHVNKLLHKKLKHNDAHGTANCISTILSLICRVFAIEIV